MKEREENKPLTKEDHESLRAFYVTQKAKFESEKAGYEAQTAKRNILLSSLTLATTFGGAIVAGFTFLARYMGWGGN